MGSSALGDGAAVGRVDRRPREPVVAGLRPRPCGARLVEVGQHHLLEERPPAGDHGEGGADATAAHHEDPHHALLILEPEPRRHQRQPGRAAARGAGWVGGAARRTAAAARRSMAPAIRWPSQVFSATPEPLQPVAYQSPSMRPQCGRRSSVSATCPPHARSTGTPASCGCTSTMRAVEVVARLVEAHGAEALAAAEHHAALVVEAPVPEQVAVVEAHAPGRQDRLGQVGRQRLGGDDEGAHRQHPPAEGGHERVGVGVGGHEDVLGDDVAPRRRDPPPVTGGDHRRGGRVRVQRRARRVGEAVSPAWKRAGWMPPLRSTTSPAANSDDPISAARSSPRTTWAGDPIDVELGRQLVEVGGAAVGVGQVELAGALVRAVDGAVGDHLLDVVEGVLDLAVQAQPQLAVGALERPRPRLQLGEHHPAVAGGRAPTEVVGVEHDHRRPRWASSVAAASPQ